MREILRTICAVLIASGCLITISVWFKYNKIIKHSANLPGRLPAYAGAIKNITQVMILFFIIGYGVGFFDVLQREVESIYYFVAIMFFVVAVFVFMVIKYLSYTIEALSDYNVNLRAEVDYRTKEIRHQGELLRVTNETVSILLASDTDTFKEDLWSCMGMLAGCVDVDRVYIWKNHIKRGILYCTQLYEWSEGATPQQGNELTIDISYRDNMPGWEQTLSAGGSVKGIVREMSIQEQGQLSPQGILSILVVPVFLQGGFWGFVGFDDCHAEREFSEAEEGILRSASLMIATCMQRNEITLSLIEAKELADRGSRTKSDFLSNMSHEIRTPINAIVGMSAIARKTDSFDRVRDCMDKIEAASRQLLGLINDILDMSKIEAGKMELINDCFDLHAALHNVKSIIGVRAMEKGLDLTLRMAANLPRAVIGDEMRLSQILLNLLSNAVKFTPVNGSIELSGELLRDTGDGYTLRFNVTDTGIGISQEQQTRLFSAFEQAERDTTRKYGGTGLGLAISKRIANLMQGDITVISALGEGSRFSVDVTLHAGSEEQLRQEAELAEVSPDLLLGKTILLAEDIEINREIIETLLGDCGAEIVSAQDGKQALELFSADPDRYELILMDVQMPVMDGLDATMAIRALQMDRAKTIPILAMTANAFDEDVRKCIEAGMNGHIPKPVDVERLFHTLQKYIDGGQ